MTKNDMSQNDYDSLIEQLLSSDRDASECAFKILVKSGRPALGPLLEALQRDDRNEEFFEYERPILRKALLKIGDPALDALIDALRIGNLGRAAIKALMFFDDERIVEPLMRVAADRSRGLVDRCYAIDALSYRRPPQAFELLVSLLREVDVFIRGHTARALGNYRDERALEALMDSLESNGEIQLMDWLKFTEWRKSVEVAIIKIQNPEFKGNDPDFFEQYLRYFWYSVTERPLEMVSKGQNRKLNHSKT